MSKAIVSFGMLLSGMIGLAAFYITKTLEYSYGYGLGEFLFFLLSLTLTVTGAVSGYMCLTRKE